MANQSIKLSRGETLELRKSIGNEDYAVGTIIKNKIYTPTKEAIENYNTINVAKSTNIIVGLADEVNGRVAVIEDKYIDADTAKRIAKKEAIKFG